jgi:O-antigen ligase
MITNLRNWGTVLLVFLLPWQARWIVVQGIHPIYGTPLEWLTLSVFATEGIIALLLFVAFFDRTFWQRVCSRIPQRVLRPLLVFLVWVWVSVTWSYDSNVAIQRAAQLSLAVGTLFLFLGADKPRRLQWSFLVSLACQSLIGLLQVATGSSFASTVLGIAEHAAATGTASVVENATGRLLRAYGTFPHPNMFGGALAVGLLLALLMYRDAVGRQRQILVGLCSICSLGLFLSFSRGAWIAFIVGCLFVVVPALFRSRGRVSKSWWYLVAAVVPTLITVIILSSFVLTRTAAHGRLETRSTTERVGSLVHGLVVFLGHPLTGVGIGQINPDVYASSAIPTEPAHLVPLQIAAELGVVSLALFVHCWINALFFVRRNSAALAVFLTLSILGLFDHYLWTLWGGNVLTAFGIFLLFFLLESQSLPLEQGEIERGVD